MKCLTDFSNLDGLATGVAGAGGEEQQQLAITDKLTLKEEGKTFNHKWPFSFFNASSHLKLAATLLPLASQVEQIIAIQLLQQHGDQLILV